MGRESPCLYLWYYQKPRLNTPRLASFSCLSSLSLLRSSLSIRVDCLRENFTEQECVCVCACLCIPLCPHSTQRKKHSRGSSRRETTTGSHSRTVTPARHEVCLNPLLCTRKRNLQLGSLGKRNPVWRKNIFADTGPIHSQVRPAAANVVDQRSVLPCCINFITQLRESRVPDPSCFPRLLPLLHLLQ